MFVSEEKKVQKEILSAREVAQEFGFAEQTVRDWARKGIVPGFRAGVNRWRFRRSDIVQYIDEQIKKNRRD